MSTMLSIPDTEGNGTAVKTKVHSILIDHASIRYKGATTSTGKGQHME